METLSAEDRAVLTAVARGEHPADLVLQGGSVVNVLSGELLRAHVAVHGDRIAYVGDKDPCKGPDTRVVDVEGQFLSPGWIEPHSHPWILYNPVNLTEALLPRGTTTVFHDNLFFYLETGPEGFLDLVEDCTSLPVRTFWLARLLSQSRTEEEDRVFSLDRLNPLLSHPRVAGSAELTRWPLAWRGSPEILEKITDVLRRHKRVDGHTAGASADKLNAVAAAGISSCHEAITAEQVLDRLRLGLWTQLRHSSLRPDLPELIRAVTEHNVSTQRLMLTMDGPGPRFIAEHGYLDEALRTVVQAGVSPVVALQMVTVNPATYFQIDHHLGSVAPGRRADIVVLDDLESFRPRQVLVGGNKTAEDDELLVDLPSVDWGSLRSGTRYEWDSIPRGNRLFEPLHPGESLPVIRFVSNVITAPGGHRTWNSGSPPSGSSGDSGEPNPESVLLGLLIDRRGRWVSRAWIEQFAPDLTALATGFTTSADLLVLGRDSEAMLQCTREVVETNGGLALKVGGEFWSAALPLGGMMSDGTFAEATRLQRRIDRWLDSARFPYRDGLYALLFLSGDFLPSWRLTPRGVWDVKQDQPVREPDPIRDFRTA